MWALFAPVSVVICRELTLEQINFSTPLNIAFINLGHDKVPSNFPNNTLLEFFF